jgi:predicted nuclease of predicted toxin-antitoxin system
MRLYLDDDMASGLLVKLLQQAGHDVQIPGDVTMSGADDPVHLTRAIRERRVILSANHDDFEDLHDLKAEGHHPGILVVRKENNPRRDLTPRGIVNAIRKLESASIESRDTFQVLNQWR